MVYNIALKELPTNINFEDNEVKNENEYKVYGRRWLILILFTLFATSNSVQYIEFSVIAHIITEYYQVSYEAVDWTTMISSVTYIVVSIPGTHYVLDKMSIRKTIIIGAIGTSLGAWVKVASVHPDRFWLIILGQGIVACFRICMLPLIPKLAATWFGYNQISTACGLCIIGPQVGSALSFVLPPLIVYNGEIADIERRLYIMNIAYATYATIMIPLMIIFFTAVPPTPPSIAHQHLIKEKNSNKVKGFIETYKTIILIKHFILYLIIFSINTGIFGPIQTLSNQIILNYYSNADYDVGIIGLLQTLMGIVGSVCTASILDKYKKYKITCWMIYFLFFASLLFYIGTIDQGMEFVYVSSIIVGILIGAVITLGFELIVEFTYPEAESVCTGLAINCMELVAVLFTILSGNMFRSIGFYWALLTMVAIIFASDLLFFFLKFDLRRKAIQDSQSKSEVSVGL